MQRVLLAVAAVSAAFLSVAAAPAFDPKPWLADLDVVREAFATKYANLEWAVFEREANLPRLFAETRERIERASDDAEARAAFDRFARRLGDGHVGFRWPAAGGGGAAIVPSGPCADFNDAYRGEPLAANAAGYEPLTTQQSREFPAGLIRLPKATVGVIKIGIFMPEGFTALCRDVARVLRIPANAPCDDSCGEKLRTAMYDRLTRGLAAQLRALKSAGANALVVDIAGNGGGSEWAEAVARMVTAIRVRSEQRRFVRGEHWAKILTAWEKDLRDYAERARGDDRALLLTYAEQLTVLRKDAETPCDSAPMWRGERATCTWLGIAYYGSGLLPEADPKLLRGKPWAAAMFSPMQYPYEVGVWSGALIVLVDRGVASAATQFTAVLRDNHAAVVMGEPTEGGCGHTDGGTPVRLPNSKGVLELPDCARLRADGSNEASGIIPDVLVGFGLHDGARKRAAAFLARLPEAAERATALAIENIPMHGAAP